MLMLAPGVCRLADRGAGGAVGMLCRASSQLIETLMKTLIDHLAQYAAYHRDRRNIATHFIGIPLIVLAVAVLLSRPGVALVGLWLSPATLTALAAGLFYCRLDLRFGLIMRS